MESGDYQYLKNLLDKGKIREPVLEIGAAGGASCRKMVQSAGFRYLGCDLSESPGVDVVADFESGIGVERIKPHGPFQTILVFNVLEHVFDPIRVLDTALLLLGGHGNLVTVTPSIWPLHGCPIDCCRLNPDWYRRFAETRKLGLAPEDFWYIGLGPIASFGDSIGREDYPLPGGDNRAWRLYSRIIHKVFRTFGRGMFFPSHLAIGALFQLGEGNSHQ